jgi:hypothetical protein
MSFIVTPLDSIMSSHSEFCNAVKWHLFYTSAGELQHYRYTTGKNDLARRAAHREAVFRTVFHSIFDAWHYEVLWICA